MKKPKLLFHIADDMKPRVKAVTSVLNGGDLLAAAARYAVPPEDIANDLINSVPSAGVYALTCPFSGRVRYVGSSINCTKRMEQHRRGAPSANRAAAWTNWLAEMHALHTSFRPIIVEVQRPNVDL